MESDDSDVHGVLSSGRLQSAGRMEDVWAVLGGAPYSHLPTPHLQTQLESLLEGAGGDSVEDGV